MTGNDNDGNIGTEDGGGGKGRKGKEEDAKRSSRDVVIADAVGRRGAEHDDDDDDDDMEVGDNPDLSDEDGNDDDDDDDDDDGSPNKSNDDEVTDGRRMNDAGMDEDGTGGRGKKNAIERMVECSLSTYSLDCYPYTFSPLLLFSNADYFDRGYSNYNAVAAFFAPALVGIGRARGDAASAGGGGMLGNRAVEDNGVRKKKRGGRDAVVVVGGGGGGRSGDGEGGRVVDDVVIGDDGGGGCDDDVPRVDATAPSTNDDDDADDYEDVIDMLHGVVYDRKNMTYDELFNHVASNQCLVTCCIDAHFTAFQMLNKNTLLYYDPLQPCLNVARGENDVYRAALYLLMKCHYGDNAHIIENEKQYTSPGSTKLQNAVYQMWKKINNIAGVSSLGIRWTRMPLNLSRYLFVNSETTPGNMSTQLTGNTCYFQTYL